MIVKIHLRFLSIALISIIAMSGCKKDAGEGGTSTIMGRVIVYDYDAAFQDTSSRVIYPALDENVYIIYGTDHSTYDDDYKTSFNGTYQFKNLQKGKYTLFAYSKDSTGAYNGTFNSNRPNIPVFVDVEITSNNSTVTAPDLIILDNNQ